MNRNATAKNRKEVQRLKIQDESGEPLGEFSVVKPTLGDQIRIFKAAKAAGECDDAGKPVDSVAQLMMFARTIAATFMDGQTGEALYSQSDAEAILDEPWFNAYVDQHLEKAEEASGPKDPAPLKKKGKGRTS